MARNSRERRRLQQLGEGFIKLKKHIPLVRNDEPISKFKILQHAIKYIKILEVTLQEESGLIPQLPNESLTDISGLLPEFSASDQLEPSSDSQIVDPEELENFINSKEYLELLQEYEEMESNPNFDVVNYVNTA